MPLDVQHEFLNEAWVRVMGYKSDGEGHILFDRCDGSGRGPERSGALVRQSREIIKAVQPCARP